MGGPAMKTYFAFLASILFCSATLNSQYASLYIQHPQKPTGGPGSIQEIVSVVQPNGSYTKNDLYLTFAAKSIPSLLPDDSVEVRLTFGFGQSIVVSDLWLWIGQDTSKAILADRSKARATYDSTVKRRRDPALLEMPYADYYSLNIYPMRADGTRKIKLSYLVPDRMTEGKLTAPLPIWLVKASNVLPDKWTIFVREDSLWTNPSFAEVSSIPLTSVLDSTFGECRKAEITTQALTQLTSLTLLWEQTLQPELVFAEKYRRDAEGVYQLAVQPVKLFDINTTKKFLFLVNYDPIRASNIYSRQQILQDITTTLRTKVAPPDSFNVIFASKGSPYRVSERWLSPDTAVITSTFSDFLLKHIVMDTFNLSALIFNGADFINKNGADGQMILIASSEEYNKNLSASNKFIDSLTRILPSKTQIHIIDNNLSPSHYSVGDRYYAGDGYLYSLLAAVTKGTYNRYPIYYQDGNNLPLINQIIPAIRGTVNYFDLTVTLANGIAFMKQTQAISSGTVTAATTVRQAGRYSGNFPMILELSGEYEGKLVYKKISIPDSNIHSSDSSLYSVWASYVISSLQNSSVTEPIKQEIADLSTRYRVLSRYTAFIALEPGQKLCDTCVVAVGGGVPVNVRPAISHPESYEVLQAFPNPFNPATTLKLRLPQGVEQQSVSLIIYNTLGQSVKQFDVSHLSKDTYTNVVWDGTDNNGRIVATGVYFVIMTTPVGRYSLKLMLLK
jgi:hypothetical protein